MTFRRTIIRRNAAVQKFVDSAFLDNQRPKIPGGSWSVEILRNKSMADLQQLWYILLKERNKLLTMRLHYFRHMEELQAMPAPSRIDMIQTSLDNIKKVIRERDDEATDKAVKMFEERVKKGMYRYPPGPQPPPTKTTSKLCVLCAAKPNEEMVRGVFSNPAVFEQHKGIVSIDISLPPEVMARKERAEREWQQYMSATVAHRDYHKFAEVDSVFDKIGFELAPGVVETGSRAADVAVPEPMAMRAPPADPLERVKWEDRSPIERATTQLGHFPNITMRAPDAPGERPTHPDEIEGPWAVTITFDSPDGATTAHGLNVTALGDIEVQTEVVSEAPEPYAKECPLYSEALRREESYQYRARNLPDVPDWSEDYERAFKAKIHDIVAYNWDNTIEYKEKEARLTNTSMYEMPVKVDHTCGRAYQVPPWASPDKEWDSVLPRSPMEFGTY
eukprot:PhM_4_TR16856/c0_g1_i1/m.95574